MAFFTRVRLALLFVTLPLLAADAPGIKNFDQVDTHVYRGGQPTVEGFKYLAQHGVMTVIDLRESGARSRMEERLVTSAGMKYVNVPMSGLTPPTQTEISRILAILEDSATKPVFVHCRRGADRTGAVIAAYHIDHDNWDNTRALKDAMAHQMSFFQIPRQNYIRSFHPRTTDAKTDPAPALHPVPAVAAAVAVAN